MKELTFMNQSPVYLEINRDSIKALRDNQGFEARLEHAADGQLTAACREKIVSGLQQFLGRKSWHPRIRALCAIGASGVTLRRLALPASAREDLPKLLRMQIESEFPLSPDDLAWGYRPLAVRPANGSPARQEFLVAAVKKERVEEYASILFAAGLSPVFTLAALARSYLCPQPLGSCAVFDLGQHHSELVLFENGIPGAVRVFPWGTDNSSGEAAVDSVVKFAGGVPAGNKFYVTAADEARPAFVRELGARLGSAARCEGVEAAIGPGRSAAVLGLKRADEQKDGLPPIFFQARAKALPGRFAFTQPAPKKWAIRCAVLLCCLLIFPYAEAVLLKWHIARKVAAIKSQRGSLAMIDQEFHFLQDLRQAEPPYLDSLYLISKAAPQGAKIESLSMNRHGEVSVRGSLKDAAQVADFRLKLMDTKFFDRVAVEEQVPTPDRQKLNVRISAQWKPFAARAGLAIGPGAEEIEKAKTNKTAAAGSPFPGGGMPMGLPPGIMIQ